MAQLPSLTQRTLVGEWMDQPGADPKLLRASLRFIEQVNRWLGYTRATLSHLERFARRWQPGERIELLDVATGSADVPRAILAWADRRGFDVRITAVDLVAATLAAARQHGTDPRRLRFVRADVVALPFEPLRFDYAICSMFFHHLSDDAVLQTMAAMDHLARRGMIVADLLRDPRAYRSIRLLTLPFNRMVRHDAVASVAAAFTREEILALRDRAGLGYLRFHPHFAHRYVLAGEKDGADATARVDQFAG